MISTKKRFEVLALGTYNFTVTRLPKLKQSDSGYDYYEFDLEAEDPSGKTHQHREFFFPNEDRLKEILIALGGKKNEEGEIEIDEHEAVGQRFKAEIKHEIIKGKERAKIVKIIRETGSSEDEEPPF
jgi:hypothetical protein